MEKPLSEKQRPTPKPITRGQLQAVTVEIRKLRRLTGDGITKGLRGYRSGEYRRQVAESFGVIQDILAMGGDDAPA